MKANNQEIEEKLNDFSDIVQEYFSFLVDDYGFVRKGLEKLDFEYPQDKQARIEYLSDFLCVRIDWHLADATMGVGLIELERGKIPEKYSYFEKKGFSRAVNLSTLVEFLSKGEMRDPLPNAGPRAGARKIMKAWRERERLIEQNKRNILATYSNWLRTYASDVLARDTSIFEPVQRYEKEKITRDYYGHASGD
jgi:hypothetical protein